MKKQGILFLIVQCFILNLGAQVMSENEQKTILNTVYGKIQGVVLPNGIKLFAGIPYALPPVGELRWKSPERCKKWKGIYSATNFSSRAMQKFMWSDMLFRSKKCSEDCLYLNIWTPSINGKLLLPVLVYIHGGGFIAGDGSEYRYDGESMAQQGVIVVTINYRMGIFGFLAHPDLTKESINHSSGNYGLLDQNAALLWVHENIKYFGGDPNKVTIAGESAGSFSVSAHIASPLSKGLFRSAIAESGSILGKLSTVSLNEAEQNGLTFAQSMGFKSIQELRSIPADSLLNLAYKVHFPVDIDGVFFPEKPLDIFIKGKQMNVPLLAGWNSAEVNYHYLLGKNLPTMKNYIEIAHKLYKNHADEMMKLYSAKTDSEVLFALTDLSSDRFIAYSTWKLIDIHSKTNGFPVYQYLFKRIRPSVVESLSDIERQLGAVHASEIEYALGNLKYNKFFKWTADDYKISETMKSYFVNFIKTGDPNSLGLEKWSPIQSSIPKVMILDIHNKEMPDNSLKRYQFQDLYLEQ